MRIKRGVHGRKKRKKILKANKGYLDLRHSTYKRAKEAFIKAGKYAYRDRKVRKRDKRRLWQVKIGNAARNQEMNYAQFINLLKKQEIQLNRKILAEIAEKYPEVFEKISAEVKNQ
ncbi:MAG: 50S ribosomal protein L20 [Candidatus Moranbacteria bacterium]|nr:50S ribosomal protein L20 [Candidatus Moranbacteria bacterium]